MKEKTVTWYRADFSNTIFLPEDVYTGFQDHPVNIDGWIKDGTISMFMSEEFAVNQAEVFAYNAVTKEQRFAFDFDKCQIPGSYFPDEVKAGRVKADESYTFLVFNFPIAASPSNRDLIQAEILVRLSPVDLNGTPFLDFWIEPSFNDELNTWLDERTDGKALLKMGNIMLNAFHYIQERMLREKQRVIKFQNREIERRNAENGNSAKAQEHRRIKIGCIQYMYIPITDLEREPRKFVRRVEAWNVRGHYRQYKSGKRVFIRPYTKGKGRIKQVEYVV